MRTVCFAVALCAATALAAPTKGRRSQPEQQVDVLDEVLAHVEEILGTDESSESKVQDILNSIINDIEARNEKREEDPLESALDRVSVILSSGDQDTEEKVNDILNELLDVVDLDETSPEQQTKRDTFSGLDLATIDNLDLTHLLECLSAIVESFEQNVIRSYSSNPSLVSSVQRLTDDVNSLADEVDSLQGLSKRDLFGVDLPTVDSLDLLSLIHDLECIVAKVDDAVVRELRDSDPTARHLRRVLREVHEVVTEVEDVADF